MVKIKTVIQNVLWLHGTGTLNPTGLRLLSRGDDPARRVGLRGARVAALRRYAMGVPAGRVNRNSAPPPGARVTAISPFIASMRPLTM